MTTIKIDQLIRSAFAQGMQTQNYIDNCKHLDLCENFTEESLQKFISDNKDGILELKDKITELRKSRLKLESDISNLFEVFIKENGLYDISVDIDQEFEIFPDNTRQLTLFRVKINLGI